MKGLKEFGHVQAAVGGLVPRGFFQHHAVLLGINQNPWDDFTIDGVGDFQVRLEGDQAQVGDVLLIVHLIGAGIGLGFGCSAEEFGDDAVNTRFAEFFGELIKMRGAFFDEMFTGFFHGRKGDGLAAVAGRPIFKAGLVTQGVDQPGLAAVCSNT